MECTSFKANNQLGAATGPLSQAQYFILKICVTRFGGFCALKGDYKSMLILVYTEPTRNVPAMRLNGRRGFAVEVQNQKYVA
jgi:hypothetical protein